MEGQCIETLCRLVVQVRHDLSDPALLGEVVGDALKVLYRHAHVIQPLPLHIPEERDEYMSHDQTGN